MTEKPHPGLPQQNHESMGLIEVTNEGPTLPGLMVTGVIRTLAGGDVFVYSEVGAQEKTYVQVDGTKNENVEVWSAEDEENAGWGNRGRYPPSTSNSYLRAPDTEETYGQRFRRERRSSVVRVLKPSDRTIARL